MADPILVDKKEVLEKIKKYHNDIQHRLELIKNSIGGGEFVFLKDNIDIVNSRVDELEKQIRAMQNTDFGVAQLIGFFFAPALGNLLIQPLFQLGMEKLFKGLATSRISFDITKRKHIGNEEIYMDSQVFNRIMKEEFDLSIPGKKNKAALLFGGAKPIEKLAQHNNEVSSDAVIGAIGGAVNDSAQNIINFALAYNKKRTELESTTLERKSVLLAHAIAILKTKIDDTKRKFQELYYEMKEAISKIEGDIFADSELHYYQKAMEELEVHTLKQGNLTDDEFSKNIIVATNNFLFISLLGDAYLGEIKIVPVNKGKGGVERYARYERPSNIPKPLIDYLIKSMPNEQNSFLVNEIKKSIKPGTSIEDVYERIGIVYIIEQIDYHINNPNKEKEKYKNYSAPVSLYDRAVDQMLDWLKKTRQLMGIISTGLINNLIDLSHSEQKR